MIMRAVALLLLLACALVRAVTLNLKSRLRAVSESLFEKFSTKSQSTGALYSVSVASIPDLKNFDASDGGVILFDNHAQTLSLEPGLNRVGEGIVWGTSRDKLEETGWIELKITTTKRAGVPNDLRMYCAGFLEGLALGPRISQFSSNFMQLTVSNEDGKKALANIENMMQDVIDYVKNEANVVHGENTSENPDPYWKHVRYMLFQMQGIVDGYNTVAGAFGVKSLTLRDMFMINSHAEMGELLQAYSPQRYEARRRFQQGLQFLQNTKNATAEKSSRTESSRKSLLKANEREWEKRLEKTGHCSALVRVTSDNEDLLVGHTTWDDYSKMTRVYKQYEFYLDTGIMTSSSSKFSNNIVAMSSYPGVVASTDDFYVLGNGLVVMSTSLELLNPEIYNRVPDFPANSKLPTWMHAMACNRMAETGGHWAAVFSERNAGIGNAQWLVVDYNLFEKKTDIKPNTLWLVEQIPGLTQKKDHSTALGAGRRAAASFNRPSFKEVRERSGHNDALRLYGNLYALDSSPRGQIFGEIEPDIESLRDMRMAMRRNNWPREKFVGKGAEMWNTPGHAISARLDLDPEAQIRTPNGGIDAKVANSCLVKNMQVQAIAGPTHEKQPVFQWKDDAGAEKFGGWPHLGLPNKYDFKWFQMTADGTDLGDRLADVC